MSIPPVPASTNQDYSQAITRHRADADSAPDVVGGHARGMLEFIEWLNNHLTHDCCLAKFLRRHLIKLLKGDRKFSIGYAHQSVCMTKQFKKQFKR